MNNNIWSEEINRELFVYADRDVLPLAQSLAESNQYPFYLPINLDGNDSDMVGRTVFEAGRTTMQQLNGDEQYANVLVFLPRQKPSKRNRPHPRFVRAIGYQNSKAEEECAPQRYREIGREFPDISSSELQTYRKGDYMKYGDDKLASTEFTFGIVHAGASGVYFPKTSAGELQAKEAEFEKPDASHTAEVVAHVVRYRSRTALVEALDGIDLLSVLSRLTRDTVKRTVREKLDSAVGGYVCLTDTHPIYQEDSSLKINVDVQVYTGHNGLDLSGRQEANIVKQKIEGPMRTIILDSVGLNLELERFARVSALQRPVLPTGEKLPTTHLVKAEFSVRIPREMQETIYRNFRQAIDENFYSQI